MGVASLDGVIESPLPPPAEAADCGPDELVRRIRAGDRPAEDELVRRYQRGVGAVLRRAGADPATADDLSQETFATSLRKIRAGEVREPERLAGFVCSLARNLAIEHFRKAGSRRTAGSPDADFASPAPGPLEDLLRTERAAVVRKVLAEMPSERDRQVLFRFYLAEEEKDRICKDLGLSSLHFNRVVFRARERYRELYLEHTKSMGRPR
jgi:RNA polymerase sigma-70 factor (ECF subfamily)